MRSALLTLLLVGVFISTIEGLRRSEDVEDEPGSHREGRLFSLFTVLSFKNTVCQTTSSSNGGLREGTCYTSSECTARGGRASGTCASGFGVCCFFSASNCGSTIDKNNTYIRNPGFPDSYDSLAQCSYTVQKAWTDICFIRLDFESFSLAGPAITESTDSVFHEAYGGVCDQDTFTVSTTTGFQVPILCGLNSGQHIYVDIGNGPQDAATLAFDFPDPYIASVDRDWEIKVSQIPCGAIYRPPNDCLQYTTGTSGTFKTFNFDAGDTPHLGNQRYSSCIRQEAGFCCIRYTPCPEFGLDSFSLDTMEELISNVEEFCSLDYIMIEGGSNVCQRQPLLHVNKFCGNLLSASPEGDVASESICDCSPPFKIGVLTDNLADNGEFGEDAENMAFSRGVCLNWQQVPCGV